MTVDDVTYTAKLGGRALDLTFKEFELLKYLAQHPGRVFTREQLLQEVWGYDYYGGTRTVDVHVRRLRAKLGPEHEQLIGTVRNVGYRFVLPPKERPDASPLRLTPRPPRDGRRGRRTASRGASRRAGLPTSPRIGASRVYAGSSPRRSTGTEARPRTPYAGPGRRPEADRAALNEAAQLTLRTTGSTPPCCCSTTGDGFAYVHGLSGIGRPELDLVVHPARAGAGSGAPGRGRVDHRPASRSRPGPTATTRRLPGSRSASASPPPARCG